jgi:L-2,4-diaminobutyrate decarboxylase
MDQKEGSWMKSLFLDPEGDNLQEFEKALTISVRLFRLWWKGARGVASPLPSRDEIKMLVAASDEDFGSLPLTEPYIQLGPCIKALFRNARFNKNNMMNVHPTPLLPAVLSSLFAMLQNPNNLSPSTSPATTTMEDECIRQLAELVGFPAKRESVQCGGNIVSCGSLSNLTALMVAREKAYMKLEPPGESSREMGLFRAPRGVIVTTTSAHYSIQKAARILGLGNRSVVRVPVVGKSELAEFEKSGTPLKLKPSKEDYAEAIETIAKKKNQANSDRQVVISAVSTLGTTNTGTIEPIQPLVDLRNEFGFHLHVDAAIGGLALGLGEVKPKVRGVECVDSITIDPHKLGFLHYPCSAIVFREKSDLETIAVNTPYAGPCASTIEGSRPGSSAAGLWVALKILGVDGYIHIISELIELTRSLARQLGEAGFQVLHEVDLNTICFSLYSEGISRKRLNKLTSDLHSRLMADGKYLLGKVEDVSGVKVRDKPWQTDSEKVGLTAIKAWIMNPYTSESDLESLVSELDQKKRELAVK